MEEAQPKTNERTKLSASGATTLATDALDGEKEERRKSLRARLKSWSPSLPVLRRGIIGVRKKSKSRSDASPPTSPPRCQHKENMDCSLCQARLESDATFDSILHGFSIKDLNGSGEQRRQTISLGTRDAFPSRSKQQEASPRSDSPFKRFMDVARHADGDFDPIPSARGASRDVVRRVSSGDVEQFGSVRSPAPSALWTISSRRRTQEGDDEGVPWNPEDLERVDDGPAELHQVKASSLPYSNKIKLWSESREDPIHRQGLLPPQSVMKFVHEHEMRPYFLLYIPQVKIPSVLPLG